MYIKKNVLFKQYSLKSAEVSRKHLINARAFDMSYNLVIYD